MYTAGPTPEGLSDEEAKAWIDAEHKNGLKIAQSFRAGSTAGLALPHGADFDLKGVSGKLPDADAPIRYHDEQIARAVLAHFLNLGTETGSWALGSTFAEFFVASLQSVAMHIADVTQQHVIDDMVALNWGPDELSPQLVFDEIGAKSPLTAEAVKQLLDSGAITNNDETEAHIRAQFGLPMKEAA